MIKTFRDLLVWQKAMKHVKEIYKISKDFPKDEVFGLTAQMRRCAVSIPSNIAEGFGRKSGGDNARFLQIAMGSLFELQTQLEIAFELEYLSEILFRKAFEDSREIERMLSSFINSVRNK